VAFPEACLLTLTALDLAKGLLEGLEVDATRMAGNLSAGGGFAASEALLAALAPRVGKHRAQELLQRVLGEARRQDRSLEAAAAGSEVAREIPPGELRSLLERPWTGAAAAMVDEAVRRARERRATEPEAWP
jgi:adenylosuccinate lyase